MVRAIAASESKYTKYIKSLVRYIRDDSQKYRVVIISNTNTQISDANEISHQILLQVPGLMINFKKSRKIPNFEQLGLFDEPRSTSLFVVIDDSLGNSKSKSDLSAIFEFLNKLSPVRSRPQVLIISLCNERNCTFEKSLRQMWSQRFLDITILQFREKNISKNKFQTLYQVNATVHHYNPFTNVYKKIKFSRKTEWFPDKLRDMNGFPIKGGLVNLPPYSKVEFNEKKNNYSGAEYLTFMVLSKVLNFSASIITSPDAKIGIENTENKTATGMIGKCVNKEINIFLTTLIPLNSKKDSSTETTRMLDLSSLYAIVPILPSEDFEVTQNLLYNTMLIFLSVLILIFIASIFLKFKTGSWHPENIMQFLLGLTIPAQPTTLREKILFLSVIIVGFCYSSTFFSGITSKNLKVTKEKEFNTFEDLDESGLQLIVHPNLIGQIFGNVEGALLNLQKKSLKIKDIITTCVEDVIKHKNASCILAGCTAIDLMESYRDETGHFTMKILRQPFWSTSAVMYLERGSPYVKRFDQVLIRLIEAGLRQKWTGRYSLDPFFTDKSTKNDEISDFQNLGGVTNLRHRLIFIALHGYLLSLFVFLVEILLYHCFSVT